MASFRNLNKQEKLWDDASCVRRDIFPLLADPIKDALKNLSESVWNRVEEIRLRAMFPLHLCMEGGDAFVSPKGDFNTVDPYKVSKEDLRYTIQIISRSSVYALEEEFRHGYLTIRGGHRIGFSGEAVVEGGQVKTLKHIASINIRFARELKGCADSLIPFIFNRQESRAYRTLIASPPRCGKTTLLRDVVRQLSDGFPHLGFSGINVGVVDERSEIAACYRGVPQNDVGSKTDVIDKSPKKEGMLILLRSMSPQVIATDEIGKPADVEALWEILNAGVGVMATVHASSWEELHRRPSLAGLMSSGVFERVVILSRRLGVGTIESIIESATCQNIIRRPFAAGIRV